jgi:hypothetical protein
VPEARDWEQFGNALDKRDDNRLQIRHNLNNANRRPLLSLDSWRPLSADAVLPLRAFDVYARCARERRPMYGGGMGELGVGRGQIELLAALFHADAPDDVAPSAYNEDDPTGGLPDGPLAPGPETTGFRWAA